jgi:nitrogen fixation protein FixH
MTIGGLGGMTRMGPTTAVSTSSVIGEARTASARVTLEFPAVTVGQDATLLVRVLDATGAPISGVRVAVLLRHDGADTTAVAVTAAESAPGVYEAAHRFPTAGVHTATAEVLTDQGNPSSVVSVAVRQEVLSGAMDGPSRRSRLLPIALLGTAAMAAMMVLMIAF